MFRRKIRLADRVGRNQAPVGELLPESESSVAGQKLCHQKQEALGTLAGSPPEPIWWPTTKIRKTCGSMSAATRSIDKDESPSGFLHGRRWTVSIALPGSIVDNAQTQELRSYLVGQVARACTIHNVDEIVVFASKSSSSTPAGGRGGRVNGSVFMARVLQYLECPQYLRKQLFPHHPDLRSVGLIPPLDAPHHLRADERCAA